MNWGKLIASHISGSPGGVGIWGGGYSEVHWSRLVHQDGRSSCWHIVSNKLSVSQYSAALTRKSRWCFSFCERHKLVSFIDYRETNTKKKKTLPRVKNVQLLAGKVHGVGSSASPSASQPGWRESGGPAEIEKRWQRSRSSGAQLLPSDLVSLGKWSKVQHKYVGSVFNMGKRSSLCVVFLPAGGGWIRNTNRKDRLAWRARTLFFFFFHSAETVHTG